MCNLNMQNSCHPLCKRDKPDNYLIMQIQETVRTNLNMQKFLGQRGGEGGAASILVNVYSKQIEEAQIETFNESANNLANLTLNLLEILTWYFSRLVLSLTNAMGWVGVVGIWHILLHAPLMHLRAKDVH